MRLVGRTLDDLLQKLLSKLLVSTNYTSPTRGAARELVGVLLELKNPRARLSRSETRGKPFSCLGEFLWYLTGDNRLDFINYYIPAYYAETEDGETIFGGYGPRLFKQRGHNQIQNVIDLLLLKTESRRAVIQIFNAEDIARRHKEVPCTCTIHFLVRQNRLHMLTNMRSNDSYKGLPHDIFCFTMVQEVLARTLGLEVGTYRHFVGSMHLYEDDQEVARQYLNEGWQSTISMPPMPIGDPWPSLRKVLDAEYRIRYGVELDVNVWSVEPYWADLIRLLQVFAATGDVGKVEALKGNMAFDNYAAYIEKRKEMTPRVVRSLPLQQLLLPL
jgi:thymidylate synthase